MVNSPTVPFLGSFLLHDRNVSICLIFSHLPATCQAGQKGFPQSFEIRNFDVAPGVLNGTGLLQRMGNSGNAIPLRTDH